GDVEGPHGQRQLHGEQPHEPGAQHRGRDEGGGRGGPPEKIPVERKREVLGLKNTDNTLGDQLSCSALEITRVGGEVGTGGRLGGPARLSSDVGTWKDLTDSVNFMASNLTGQVRNIADVTTGLANGDLSRKITVDVRGEILELKDTINTMV